MMTQYIKANLTREDLPRLIRPGGTCVELGVFKGYYSEKILKNSQAHILYSIDRWTGERGHDEAEEQEARERLRPYPKKAGGCLSVVWKDDFDDALRILKEDRSRDIPFLDFVYFDGYAHEGNGGIKRLHEWTELVRPGGMISGHDYDHAFPKNVEAIHQYFATLQYPFFYTKEERNPSWFTFKR